MIPEQQSNLKIVSTNSSQNISELNTHSLHLENTNIQVA